MVIERGFLWIEHFIMWWHIWRAWENPYFAMPLKNQFFFGTRYRYSEIEIWGKQNKETSLHYSPSFIIYMPSYNGSVTTSVHLEQPALSGHPDFKMQRLLLSSVFLFTTILMAHPSAFESAEDPPSRLLKQHDIYKELYPYETPIPTSELMNPIITPRAIRYF